MQALTLQKRYICGPFRVLAIQGGHDRFRFQAGKTFLATLLLLVIFFHIFLFYPPPLGNLSLTNVLEPPESIGTEPLNLTSTPPRQMPHGLPPRSGEGKNPPDLKIRQTFPERQEERNEMVRVIKGYGMEDEAVARVMSVVPRHRFVPFWLRGRSYDDSPLPIGYGQTISQPFIVAEMTRALQLSSGSRVLEIGTGSGYQAAVLAEFTRHVFSIEIVRELAEQARERLKELGYESIKIKVGDGWNGWPEEAPFDGIIVTCAAGQIPPPLVRQLAPGGKMVIPVGAPFSTQWLMLLTKDPDGKVSTQNLMAVSFVPFIHDDAGNR